MKTLLVVPLLPIYAVAFIVGVLFDVCRGGLRDGITYSTGGK